MTTPIRVLGFSGSLRKGSANTGLLRVAAEVLPEGMTLDVFDIAPIPFYNADVEAEGRPEPVNAFREAIRTADALLIACPEYNYSIPGVLKNAIDWASRGADQPFAGKPVALMGAGGGLGTARSQYHLRQVCVFLDMHPLNKPELFVPMASQKFDRNGNLTDDSIKERVGTLLTALAAWTERLK
jgi:chromate reductase